MNEVHSSHAYHANYHPPITRENDNPPQKTNNQNNDRAIGGSGNHDGGSHKMNRDVTQKRVDMQHSAMGGHEDYTAKIFENLDTIKNNLGFDVLEKFNELYDSLEGSNISGDKGSMGRENRDKYNEGIKEIMGDLFAEIDHEVSNYGSYDQLPQDLKNTVDATTSWIQLGMHAGQNNDMGTMTHALEKSTTGPEGAAFVLAHAMQAGDDTEMDALFRNGREIDREAMDKLDGAALFGLMKDKGGLTGLYEGKNGTISTFWGASADVDANANQNPASARDFFSNPIYADYISGLTQNLYGISR